MDTVNNIIYKSTDRTSVSLLLNHDPDAVEFVNSVLDTDIDSLKILATTTRFNIDNLPGSVSNIVNIKKVNDVRYINKFFEAVNAKLREGGLYIGYFESKGQRKERIFKKMPKYLAYPFYILDFIWKRIFPKLSLTKTLYFSLTKGHNRVLTISEVLGRLVCCGFRIETYREINNKTYFAVRKTDTPAYDMSPTYGALVKLNRIGLDGKEFDVYKFRTMHPYAEYLQDFVYQKNNLQNGGKFKNDFRITNWGCIMRKLWLDELPMLWNWIRGDLKLVGVRPLSRHYFELYPETFKERRLQYKPGLFPPFYVDLPETFDEIVASERKYLAQYDKRPIRTDMKYLFMALYNIFIKRARSK